MGGGSWPRNFLPEPWASASQALVSEGPWGPTGVVRLCRLLIWALPRPPPAAGGVKLDHVGDPHPPAHPPSLVHRKLRDNQRVRGAQRSTDSNNSRRASDDARSPYGGQPPGHPAGPGVSWASAETLH